MEFLPSHETLMIWLTSYGDFAIFGLLALGIIALPVPEETLMVIIGILMDNGTLAIIPTIISALAGSICGITVSYAMGRLAGNYVLVKYGPWIGITEAKIQKIHNWFEHYGKWTLVIGYFIPGVRHFTGFTAGLTALEYHEFALFAYSGAVIWVTTFISIGYFFGNYGLSFFEHAEISVDVITASIIIVISALIIRFWVKNGR